MITDIIKAMVIKVMVIMETVEVMVRHSRLLSYLLGYGSQGYGYENPPPAWGPNANGDNGFGNYPQQQSYGGGPMRGGQPPYSRPGPYSQNNNWQQRQ